MKPPELSDEQLIETIRENDRELYSEIIKRYKTRLSHYLRKFVCDADGAVNPNSSGKYRALKNINKNKIQK